MNILERQMIEFGGSVGWVSPNVMPAILLVDWNLNLLYQLLHLLILLECLIRQWYMKLGVNVIVHQELSHIYVFVFGKGVKHGEPLLEDVVILNIFLEQNWNSISHLTLGYSSEPISKL
jgi:hypothetical protein